MTLWLVGQYRIGENPNTVWDFQGVFSTKAGAIAACQKDTYFVVPLQLDAEVPNEPMVIPGAWYPHRQKEPTATLSKKYGRVSVRETAGWGMKGQAFLNSEDVSARCFEADDIAGYVCLFKLGPNGKFYMDHEREEPAWE